MLDGYPHTSAFSATVNQVPITALSVIRFGQSGSIEETYGLHGLDTDGIVRAGLDLAG